MIPGKKPAAPVPGLLAPALLAPARLAPARLASARLAPARLAPTRLAPTLLVLTLLALTLLLGAGTGTTARAQTPAPSELPAISSLDADATPVSDILQILASRSGLNIVMSPAVQGRIISIHLRDTPFEDALNLVVRAAGLSYERVGGSILVAEAANLSVPTGLVTRVFNLQYANADDVRAMLEILTKDVTASPSNNQLVIRSSQSVIDQAAEIIRQIDRKPQQILLEARLIEVSTSSLLQLGIQWDKIGQWSTVLSEGNPGQTAPGTLPTALGFVKANQSGDFYRQLAAFDVSLDALLTEGRAKLLSNAKVVTIDGKQAEIFAGETVPVVVTSLQSPGSSGGVLQTVQLQKVDVGVKLDITPRIGGDSLITVLVQPEVSTIERYVGPNSDLPQTATRRANSLVRVRQGEKIFLGGLLSDSKLRTLVKIPVLGSIPVLGGLFRHYRDDNTTLDLIIEVTPTIVGDAGRLLPVAPANDQRR